MQPIRTIESWMLAVAMLVPGFWVLGIKAIRGSNRNGQLTRLGQHVLTGSIPSLIPIREDCRIRVDASPFGSVEVEYIA